MARRVAFTLLELIITITVIAILVGLVMVAVQNSRMSALEIECMNRQKQLVLATANFASSNKGILPPLTARVSLGDGWIGQVDLIDAIMPFHDQIQLGEKETGRGKFTHREISAFACSLDPTIASARHVQRTSYAANAQIFETPMRLPADFRDGVSQTILFAEHYADDCNGVNFAWRNVSSVKDKNHRATFADDGPKMSREHVDGISFGDVYPVTQGLPPRTTGSVPGLTFQVRPTIAGCDPRIPQTGHSGGMAVALADCSVRVIASSISPATFWSLVTPAGEEVIGNDW